MSPRLVPRPRRIPFWLLPVVFLVSVAIETYRDVRDALRGKP